MWSELKKSNILPAELQEQAVSFSLGEIDDVLVGLAVKVPMPSVLRHCSLQKEQSHTEPYSKQKLQLSTAVSEELPPLKYLFMSKKHFEALRSSSDNVYE